jgi:hypothetical protein
LKDNQFAKTGRKFWPAQMKRRHYFIRSVWYETFNDKLGIPTAVEGQVLQISLMKTVDCQDGM